MDVNMAPETLDDRALDQLFREARTHNKWQDRPVPDAKLRELYDLLKFGPTSANASPARFVFVRTRYADNSIAAGITINVVKLSGNYPVPPGPYVTNSVGQIWIALYPGVYRFSVNEEGAAPDYWDVQVASMGEYYIFFTLPLPEM